MDNEQKKDEQEMVGSDANVTGREMDRRDLGTGEARAKPIFDVDEADLVVKPAEVQPNPVAFTDADPVSVQKESVTAGRPVQVENVTGVYDEPSPAERTAASARSQANVAAEAFRRGEFMRDATIDPAANSDDRLIALLSYATQVLIPFVMPALVLFSESSKNRPFQRFHAVQSLALSAVLVVLAIFVAVGTAIISIVPVIGWLIAGLVACLSPILVLMAWFALVYYGYQAYQGKRFAIPGLTSFLKDQRWI
jgi:uncharacterized membrane protein